MQLLFTTTIHNSAMFSAKCSTREGMAHSQHAATSGIVAPESAPRYLKIQIGRPTTKRPPTLRGMPRCRDAVMLFENQLVYPLHVLILTRSALLVPQRPFDSTNSPWHRSWSQASRSGACLAASLASKSTAARQVWTVFVAAARRLSSVIQKRATDFAACLATTAARKVRWQRSRSHRVRMGHGTCSTTGVTIAANMGFRGTIVVIQIGAGSRAGRLR